MLASVYLYGHIRAGENRARTKRVGADETIVWRHVDLSRRPTALAAVTRARVSVGPDLEVVDVGRNASVLVVSHGYPFRTHRWHFHPEYEIHLVVETTGLVLVGDHIGRYAPGNLVMTGPNLPHNWISDAQQTAAHFNYYVQFTEEFISGCLGLFPEFASVEALLLQARRGVEFAVETGQAARPILAELLVACGPRRIALFMRLLDLLTTSVDRQVLASSGYEPAPSDYLAEPLNHVLSHIKRNLTGVLRESELAALCGCSRSAFSRRFRRHTGLSFVQYVNRLRIHRACGLLTQDADLRVIDVCYQSGFNNLSNFNRQFLSQKKVTPSAYRDSHNVNPTVAEASTAARRGWHDGLSGRSNDTRAVAS